MRPLWQRPILQLTAIEPAVSQFYLPLLLCLDFTGLLTEARFFQCKKILVDGFHAGWLFCPVHHFCDCLGAKQCLAFAFSLRLRIFGTESPQSSCLDESVSRRVS